MPVKWVRFLALALHAVAGWWWVGTTPLQDIDLPDNVPSSAAFSTVRVGLGPDEKEHYIYARSISEGLGIPAPDPERRRRPDQWVSYQAQHPPLFYATAAAVLKGTGGFAKDIQWLMLRLLCLGWGLAGIWFAGAAIEQAFSESREWTWAGTLVLAGWPMLGHMDGNLSNEPMSMAFAAASWWWTVRALRRGDPGPGIWMVSGLLLGVAGLCRLTALIWLPALVFLAVRRSPNRGKSVLALAIGCLLPLLPWMVANCVEYGRPVLRTFHRPLFESVADIARFFSGGIAPPNAGMVLVPATVLLWFAGCVWLPIWLAQFHAPGGVLPISAVSLLLGIGVALRLAWLASQARRGARVPLGAVEWDVVRAAAIVVTACFAGQIWQMGWSDWDVVFSTGRYTVASAGALIMLVLVGTVVGVKQRGARVAIAAAWVGVIWMANIASVGWVRTFYREHPTQDSVQSVERP